MESICFIHCFIYRIYNRIRKHLSDNTETLKQLFAESERKIDEKYSLRPWQIFLILIHYYVIFLVRAMDHAKYALIVHCRIEQE